MCHRMTFQFWAGLVFAALSVSCSNGSSSGGGGATTSIAASSTSLQGTWLQACSSNASSTLVASASTVTVTATAYDTSTCAGTAELSIVYSTSYTVGSASTTVANATNITLATPTTVQMTPLTATLAAQMNSVPTCGINTWSANVPQTIAFSNACLNGGASEAFTGNQIFEVTGNTLYLGNGTATALDTSQPWTHQ